MPADVLVKSECIYGVPSSVYALLVAHSVMVWIALHDFRVEIVPAVRTPNPSPYVQSLLISI